MKTIITVIGGGSVNWMPTLMRDVYMLDSLKGGEIRLFDPCTERTEAVAGMLRQFNKQQNKDFQITVHADRKAALASAKIVISTFSPGGIDGLHYDLEVPVKYGVVQPVSCTIGPAGISNSIRTVPEAFQLVEDMEAVCPGAWLLSETNPMTAVTMAMNMAAKTVKVIGMCHEFHAFGELSRAIFGFNPPEELNLYDYLYRWLPEQGFDFTVCGINHFIWLTEAKLNGKDALDIPREYAAKNQLRLAKSSWKSPFDNWAPRTSEEDFNLYPWENEWQAKLEACRQWDYLSIGGDRHMIEFIPSLCNVRNGFGMQYGVNKTTGDHRKHLMEMRLKTIQNYASGAESIEWKKSPEELTCVIQGILENKPMPCIVNLPNKGQIENLPIDAIVETFATVDASGIKPKPSGKLPEVMAVWARLHLAVVDLTVKAGMEGSRQHLIEALSLDPLCGQMDFRDIPKLADDLLNATREWLPRFQ